MHDELLIAGVSAVFYAGIAWAMLMFNSREIVKMEKRINETITAIKEERDKEMDAVWKKTHELSQWNEVHKTALTLMKAELLQADREHERHDNQVAADLLQRNTDLALKQEKTETQMIEVFKTLSRIELSVGAILSKMT